MSSADKDEYPRTPENAEETIKCRQCGNMIAVGETSIEEMVSCPICGATMSAADILDTDTSNEDY